MQTGNRYQCIIRRRHHHTRGSHVCQTLLQKPSRAKLTYPSPLRRRTSTAHDYVHTETLQATRWRSTSFSIKAKLATLWRHRSGQPLPRHRKQLARIYKRNLGKFRLEYRSRVLRSAVRCKVRRRHRHIRGSHVCQTLLQEPSRASLTYPPPLRLRTSTGHDHVHADTLQTTTWMSFGFSIIAKLAPLWRHNWRQYLSIQRKPVSWIDKHRIPKQCPVHHHVLAVHIVACKLGPWQAHTITTRGRIDKHRIPKQCPVHHHVLAVHIVACKLGPWQAHTITTRGKANGNAKKGADTSATSTGGAITQEGAAVARRSHKSQAEQTSHTPRHFG